MEKKKLSLGDIMKIVDGKKSAKPKKRELPTYKEDEDLSFKKHCADNQVFDLTKISLLNVINLLPTPYKTIPSKKLIEFDVEIYNKFIQLWGAREREEKYYPGSNPISLSKTQLTKVNFNKYMICEKTDGVRYSLLLFKRSNNKPTSVMIDRACNMYSVNIIAHQTFFNDSLMEGELIWQETKDGKKLVFLIFDIVHLKGQSLKDRNFSIRYDCIRQYFPKSFSDLPIFGDRNSLKNHIDQGNILFFSSHLQNLLLPKPVENENQLDISLFGKSFYKCHEFLNLKKDVSILQHKSDGFIFNPIFEGIKLGTSWNLFKWKKEKHTIDLQLVAFPKNSHSLLTNCENWNFSLYYVQGDLTVAQADKEDRNEKVEYLNACLGFEYNSIQYFFHLKNSENLKALLNLYNLETRQPLKCIVECSIEFDKEFNKIIWCDIEKFRSDKVEPNNRYTIRQTLLNVEENLDEQEITNHILGRDK